MANPQKEKGYTQIANEILEAVWNTKELSATQLKILLILWRYTYGFNRKEAAIAQKYIADATGAHISSVRRELKKLKQWGIVHEISPAGFNKSTVYEFNKNYSEWKVTQVACTLPPSTDARSERSCSDTGSVDATLKIQDNKNMLQVQRAYARFYSENIGIMLPYTSQEAETFLDDGMTDEMITFALELAVANNARNWSYAKAILNRWVEEGIDSIEKAKADQLAFQNRRNRSSNRVQEDKKAFEQREYTDDERDQRKKLAYEELKELYGSG